MALVLKREPAAVALPTALTEPSSQFVDYSTLLYGERKIGKTTLCSAFPDPYFLMFEPGGKGIRARQTEVKSWRDYKKLLELLKTTPGYCKTVVVDTIDMMYDKCFKHVCDVEGMSHPSDKGYGKGWSAVSSEFSDGFMPLLQLGIGVVVISHAKIEKFVRQDKTEFDKMIPTVPGQAAKFVAAMMDNLIYYGYYGTQRYMTIHGSDATEAGTRCEDNFWVKGTRHQELIEKAIYINPDDSSEVVSEDTATDEQKEMWSRLVNQELIETGTRVHSINCGNSPREAYYNLQRAFQNMQETDGRPAVDKVSFLEEKKPMGKK